MEQEQQHQYNKLVIHNTSSAARYTDTLQKLQ